MSTPLFIRTPVAGADQQHVDNCVPGQDLTTVTQSTPSTSLLFQVAQPTLVEELLLCARDHNTLAGEVVVFVTPSGLTYDNAVPVQAYAFPAGVAAPGALACLRVALNLTLPTGWSLLIAHDVKQSGGVSYTTLGVVALGGVVQ